MERSMAQRRAVTNQSADRAARRSTHPTVATRRVTPSRRPPWVRALLGVVGDRDQVRAGVPRRESEIVDQRVELTVLASRHHPSTERSTTATTRRFSVRQRITPPGGCDVRQPGTASQSTVTAPNAGRVPRGCGVARKLARRGRPPPPVRAVGNDTLPSGPPERTAAFACASRPTTRTSARTGTGARRRTSSPRAAPGTRVRWGQARRRIGPCHGSPISLQSLK